MRVARRSFFHPVLNAFLPSPQMTKKIKKLEKETAMYRSRWESSNKALVEMAEEVWNTFLLRDGKKKKKQHHRLC